MGLDNYFQRTKNSPEIVVFPENLHLCGGIFSGNGDTGSFRGKVYNDFFSTHLDTSLYDEHSPKEVGEIAAKLVTILLAHEQEDWHNNQSWVPAGQYDWKEIEVSNQELCDLTELFSSASKQKMKLVAWY